MGNREILAWLNSRLQHYPAGVPRQRSEPSPMPEPPSNAPRQLAVLFVVGESSALSSEERMLIDSAAMKGMKLSSAEYGIEDKSLIEALEPPVRHGAARVIIMLDSTLERGWERREETPLFRTFSPKDVLSSPGTKRAFWADLQEVMKRIEEVK